MYINLSIQPSTLVYTSSIYSLLLGLIIHCLLDSSPLRPPSCTEVYVHLLSDVWLVQLCADLAPLTLVPPVIWKTLCPTA